MNKKILVPLIAAGLVTSFSVNASTLSATFADFAGASADKAAVDLLDAGCAFSKAYKDKIMEVFSTNLVNTSTSNRTQYQFAKEIGGQFHYDRTSTDAEDQALVNFLEVTSSGSIIQVCPTPLVGFALPDANGQNIIHVCQNPLATGTGEEVMLSHNNHELTTFETLWASRTNNANLNKVKMSDNGVHKYSGIRIIAAGDVNGDVTFLPVAAQEAGQAKNDLSNNNNDRNPVKPIGNTVDNGGQTVCPSLADDGVDGTECTASDSTHATNNSNIASYEIYIYGASTGTPNPKADSTLWQIEYEMKNIHSDPATNSNVASISGSLDVLNINGDALKEFDDDIVTAASNYGWGF
jgi:hypothetical protein